MRVLDKTIKEMGLQCFFIYRIKQIKSIKKELIMRIFFFLCIFFTLFLAAVHKTVSSAHAGAMSLSAKEQAVVLISAQTAVGDMQALEQSFHAALDAGVTVNEIKETLVHVYAYAGFPRSLNGINMFMEVLEKRKQKGKTDNPGEEGRALSAEADKESFGAEMRNSLTGRTFSAKYAEFVPIIDVFLKEHLFADIFGRGVLTNQEREMATLAVLSSLEGLDAQLNSHINLSLNIKVPPRKLIDIFTLTRSVKGIQLVSAAVKTESDPLFFLQSAEQIQIIRRDSLPKEKLSAQHFIGTALFENFASFAKSMNISAGLVHFESNAKTKWHSHPEGQLVIICKGHGQVQQEGGKIIDVYEGDAVFFPPFVKHWHGAGPDGTMSHYAFAGISHDSSSYWQEPDQ